MEKYFDKPEKIEKLFLLDRLLSDSKYPVSQSRILDCLECSRSTFFRLKNFLIYLGVPLEFDQKYKGYFYNTKDGDRIRLLNIWFTAKELQAFASLDKAVNELSQGLFGDTFKPFRQKIDSLFKAQNINPSQWRQKIKVISIGNRKIDETILKTITDAALKKRRVEIIHKPLGKAPVSREISPVTLIRYRDNWYIDAWCHLRSGLRTFAIDRILSCKICKGEFKIVNQEILEKYFGAAFGIFTGPPRATAEIVFKGDAAEEVSKQQWHPLQESSTNNDGTYTLKIPYSDSRELIMDILKWGDLAEVKGPEELREEIGRVVGRMRGIYEG